MNIENLKRGQFWACTYGGRALIQGVGKGKHSGLVLVSFLGSRKARWVDPRQAFKTRGSSEWVLVEVEG